MLLASSKQHDFSGRFALKTDFSWFNSTTLGYARDGPEGVNSSALADTTCSRMLNAALVMEVLFAIYLKLYILFIC
jgi:hypothetical protein